MNLRKMFLVLLLHLQLSHFQCVMHVSEDEHNWRLCPEEEPSNKFVIE